MALYFIGIGPSIDYLSVKALEILSRVDKVIVDTYTSIVDNIDHIEDYIPGSIEIVYARRKDLEGGSIDKIVEEALSKDIALLVPGDPFIATTHDAIRIEAVKKGVKVEVIYGVSIYSMAASATGLQAYKFGKTVTLVYPTSFKPYSVIETIYDNMDRGLHTLLLLDLKLEEGIAMTIPEAVEILLTLEKELNGRRLPDAIAVGLAKLGTRDEKKVADYLRNLGNHDYPGPPHAIVIVGKLHPMEKEALETLCRLRIY